MANETTKTGTEEDNIFVLLIPHFLLAGIMLILLAISFFNYHIRYKEMTEHKLYEQMIQYEDPATRPIRRCRPSMPMLLMKEAYRYMYLVF